MTTAAEGRQSEASLEHPIYEARDVHFSYTPGRPVVRGASFEVRRGKLNALIGANGCGKSTFIRLLIGLRKPDHGEILFERRPLASIARRDLARRVGYVPQSNAVTFPFTALEVVLTGRSPYTGGYSFENEQDREKARRALAAVDALDLAERPMTELSGGERQLVSVARALAQEPSCLLLDEPSAGLDLKHRAGLIRILCGLRDTAGLTALVVTHDLQLLDPSFDYVFSMRSGMVIAQGSPAEILRDSILSQVYDDAHVRSRRLDGRTFIWSES